MSKRSMWLLVATILLVVLPLAFGTGSFTGSDDQASALITQAKPGFEPWFQPLWEPPSSEIESLLFALQAALGAGVICYVLGRYHERAIAKRDGRKPDARA